METESTTELAIDTFDGVESEAADAESSVGPLRRRLIPRLHDDGLPQLDRNGHYHAK